MAFAVQDFEDLMRLLSERPEWQDRLRRQILSDDFLQLPAIVRDLVEAQARTERRVEELAEAQGRTERRVEELAEAQKSMQQQLQELAEAQEGTQQQLRELAVHVGLLAERQERMDGKLGRLMGDALETRYRTHCAGYFGRWLWRPQVVPAEDLDDAAEERLTPDERDDVMLVDLAIRGRLRAPLGEDQVVLALEVAGVVDESDVERAVRRAGLLRRALGQPVVPGVAGESILLAAEDDARKQSVAVLQDGRRFLWEEAVRRWAAS